ncbi:DUF6289 family protein [Brevundimonas sp.]|uniref:DUF6289 family protein n=1 Tax=Brevundimonas sp. TaxID=1871086 RepID=UPI0025BD6968|nr:DUF6289 family protein [Brevundimonas sp.]
MFNAKRIAVGLSSLSILAAAVAVAATAPAQPAAAAGQSSFRIYEFTYYSDANHSTVVGYARQACSPNDPGFQQWGTVTQYVVSNPIGYCSPDDGGVIH